MRKNLRTFLTATVVIGALAGGPGLYAQAQSAGSQEPGGMMGQGGMMQGGQGSMMNMMQQMSGMMDACTKMMQSMAQQPAPAAPKEQQAPKKDG